MEGSRVAALLLQCNCYCKSVSVWQAGRQGRRNKTGRDDLTRLFLAPECTYLFELTWMEQTIAAAHLRPGP